MATGSVFHTEDETVSEYTLTWTVDNFEYLSVTIGDYLQSPVFGNAIRSNWSIHLYPGGITEECSNYISVAVRNTSYDSDGNRMLVMICILDSDNIMKEINRFCTNINDDVLIRRFCERSCVGTIHQFNKLTMYCQVKVFRTNIVLGPPPPPPPPQLEPPACSLAEDLRTLLESGEHHDMTLNAEGREVRAHKIILATRAPVFASMFEHKFAEKKENSVHIEDMSFDVLMEVLVFLYTGKAPNLDSLAREVLPAADMYALETLKAQCERVLCSGLNVENAAETLVLAYVHSAPALKRRAVSFIGFRYKQVMKTTGWKEAIQYPHILEDVLRTLFQH